MKPLFFIFAALVAGSQGRAQWAVIDAANLTQSITNYAGILQQISNQAQQIQQAQDMLSRLGNMANVTAIVGFPTLQGDLTLPTQMKTWTANLSGVTGTGLFGDTRNGVYAPVSDHFTEFDGTSLSRDPSLYKPAQGITASVNNFETVQTDVYARRAQLRQAIAQTSAALQAATTEAQERKLSAILNAQYGELASVDAEVMLSAAEVQAKAAEATAMMGAKGQADMESRTQLSQDEAVRITTAFQPSYASVLQNVTEQRFQE
jgi:hypothetical protein